MKGKFFLGFLILVFSAGVVFCYFFLKNQNRVIETSNPPVLGEPVVQNSIEAHLAGGPTQGPYVHKLMSASSLDGVDWLLDEAIVMEHASVPDVFWNGEEWVMFFTSMTDNTQEGLKMIIATSLDGLFFEYEQELDTEEFILVQPILRDDGSLLAFGFNRFNGEIFESFVSEDGFDWAREGKVMLTAPDGKRITDPQFVQLTSGAWKMILKMEDVLR